MLISHFNPRPKPIKLSLNIIVRWRLLGDKYTMSSHLCVKGPTKEIILLISHNSQGRTNKIGFFLRLHIFRRFKQLLNFTKDNTLMPISKRIYCESNFSSFITSYYTIFLMKCNITSLCLMLSWKIDFFLIDVMKINYLKILPHNHFMKQILKPQNLFNCFGDSNIFRFSCG